MYIFTASIDKNSGQETDDCHVTVQLAMARIKLGSDQAEPDPKHGNHDGNQGEEQVFARGHYIFRGGVQRVSLTSGSLARRRQGRKVNEAWYAIPSSRIRAYVFSSLIVS